MGFVKSVITFYKDGFSNMRLGKKLWAIIIIKLIILFAIIKLLFFPNFLDTHFKTEEEKSDYIIESLTHLK
jgi:hypothetical protein